MTSKSLIDICFYFQKCSLEKLYWRGNGQCWCRLLWRYVADHFLVNVFHRLNIIMWLRSKPFWYIWNFLIQIQYLLSVSLNGHHRTIHGEKANELLHIIHGEKANVLHHTTLGGREEKGLHLTTLGELARELHLMTLGELERRECLPTALGALGSESLPTTHGGKANAH